MLSRLKKCKQEYLRYNVPNLLGNVPDWEKIYKIAKKYGLKFLRTLQTQSVTHLKIKIQVNIMTLLLIVFMLHI